MASEKTKRKKSPSSPAGGRSKSSSLVAWKAAIEVDDYLQPPLKQRKNGIIDRLTISAAESAQGQWFTYVYKIL
jgi:hypothetical protein